MRVRGSQLKRAQRTGKPLAEICGSELTSA